MLKIVATGIGSREIFSILQNYDPNQVQCQIMSDLEGAKAVKRGEADYYLGACYSGQGGALAAAIAVLGYNNTSMVGEPGRGPDLKKIAVAVEKDVKAFGMTNDQIEKAVPIVVEMLFAKHGLSSGPG